MNAQIVVAIKDALDGAYKLVDTLNAGARATPMTLGQAAVLLEGSAQRVRGVANGMLPTEEVVPEAADVLEPAE